MKWFILIGLLILVACARTQVVYYPAQINQTIQEPKQEVEAEDIVVPEPSQLNVATQNRTIQTTQQRRTTDNEDDFEASEEYTITSCCSEGRLYSQAKNERNDYTINEAKDLLVTIYQDNCNEFKKYDFQRVYLRFKNEVQDNNFLTHINSLNYKRVQVDAIDVNNQFEACS